ncbi:hypothetical protein [Enterobacter mori]|uniref:hypothetical protein n=1 Tax=Enterobacter mori TaxID=539813 RepID=UPI003B84399E
MTQLKTETGKLLDGIPFGDARHVDFEIRLAPMCVTGQALDETEEKYGKVNGWQEDTFYRVAVLAGSLVRLGDIPKEELTAELLHEHLTEDDYNLMQAAVERLKAKRNGGNPGSPDTDSPSLSSESTELPKSE